MSARAFVAIVDDISARGVRLNSEGDLAFEILSGHYHERYKAEIIVAFGDMLMIDPEPCGCMPANYLSGQPITSKTLEQLLQSVSAEEATVLIYDARTASTPLETLQLEPGLFARERKGGGWSEFHHQAAMPQKASA